jgi:hypothetical protein
MPQIATFDGVAGCDQPARAPIAFLMRRNIQCEYELKFAFLWR